MKTGTWLAISLVFLGLYGLSSYTQRTEAIALPDTRLRAQNTVQALAIPEAQKKDFLQRIATAPDRQGVETAVWNARWEGDPAYRAEAEARMKTYEAAEARNRESMKRIEQSPGGRRSEWINDHIVWILVPFAIAALWLIARARRY